MSKRVAIFFDETLQREDGTFFVGLATEDEPGYVPLNLAFDNAEEAADFRDTYNEGRLGLDEDSARDVVASSMSAGRVRRG